MSISIVLFELFSAKLLVKLFVTDLPGFTFQVSEMATKISHAVENVNKP